VTTTISTTPNDGQPPRAEYHECGAEVVPFLIISSVPIRMSDATEHTDSAKVIERNPVAAIREEADQLAREAIWESERAFNMQ
jgi:hypothetical protein